MVRITQSKNDKVTTVDDDRIIWMQELIPFWKDQQWNEFPLLKHNVYEWSKKNKCNYLRTKHLHVRDIAFKKALMFKNAEQAKKFRAKWVDPLLRISSGRYGFTDDEWQWNPVESMSANPEVSQWFYKNNIEIIAKDSTWLLFNSTNDMLLFKMRWI